MGDLDDEFARFQAEIRSLEQPSRPLKEDEEVYRKQYKDVEPTVKKVQTETNGSVAPLKPVVVMAKPKIYMAPPRPAPVKKALPVESILEDGTEAADGRPRMLNTLEDVAAHRGALSGFPVGTTGEHAAVVVSQASGAIPLGGYRSLQPRMDMDTGHVLPIEEQEMMNRQQSVYEYDPKRTAASIAAGLQGKDRAGFGKGGGRKHKRSTLR